MYRCTVVLLRRGRSAVTLSHGVATFTYAGSLYSELRYLTLKFQNFNNIATISNSSDTSQAPSDRLQSSAAGRSGR